MKIIKIILYIFYLTLFYINCENINNNNKTNTLENFIITLTETEFKDKVLNNLNEKVWLIKFYAPWCIHCKNLYPEIIKVSEFFKDDDNINIAKVDCTIETKLCKKYNINGYPTIRLYYKGKYIKEYKRAKRTYLNIIKFIQRGTQPDIVNIENIEKLKELSSDLINYPMLIILFNNKNEIKDYYEVLNEISKRNIFDITLGITYLKEIKNEILKLSNSLDHKYSQECSSCMVMLGKNNYSPILRINKDVDFIMNYIQQYRFPFINIPSKTEFMEYLNSGNIIVIMAIDNNKINSFEENEYINEFSNIAKKVRQELFLPIKFEKDQKPRGIIFTIIEFSAYSSLFREFGITNFNYIQGYEIVIIDGLKYYYNRSDMMKIPVLFNTIQLIINQDKEIPRFKAYSIFSINTIKRFLYDLNVVISDIFYKSWYHAIAVTLISCLMVAGITVYICLIFFGDIAESYLLDDLVEMQEKKQALDNIDSDDDKFQFENNKSEISKVTELIKKTNKENQNICESKKDR